MAQSVLEMSKDLVLAQIKVGQMTASENVQKALHAMHQSLLALKLAEDQGDLQSNSPAPESAQDIATDWKKSITKHTVTCLECGETFKQLSVRHLKEHGLDGRIYRSRYGIPRTQPLSAKTTTAQRREIVKQSRPWEKAPTYLKSKEVAGEVAPMEPVAEVAAPPAKPSRQQTAKPKAAKPKTAKKSASKSTGRRGAKKATPAS